MLRSPSNPASGMGMTQDGGFVPLPSGKRWKIEARWRERERREVRRVDDMRVPHAKSASQS